MLLLLLFDWPFYLLSSSISTTNIFTQCNLIVFSLHFSFHCNKTTNKSLIINPSHMCAIVSFSNGKSKTKWTVYQNMIIMINYRLCKIWWISYCWDVIHIFCIIMSWINNFLDAPPILYFFFHVHFRINAIQSPLINYWMFMV